MGSDHHAGYIPLVSVVMPVYNPHPKFFRMAVKSILAQNVTDWELIIVEDPSSRSASETLQTLSDPRIRHILNPSRTSQLDQRNRTLKEARGRFIAFMDADDISRPFRFARQLNFLCNHPDVDVVGSQVSVIDSEDRVVGYRWFPSQHDDILLAITHFLPVSQPTIMLRREVVDSLGGFRFAEFLPADDYEYWSRLIKSGVRFANFPEPLLYYRIHPHQLKQKNLRQIISANLRIKNLYWSDQLDFMARVLIWVERVLLYLPKRFVAWLVLRYLWHYRKGSAGLPVTDIS